MNREILFRGQKSSTKEWIEGSLIINKAGDHVITQVIENPVHLGTLNGWCFAVLAETIGQYTGLKDKNGVKIFEGDVCKYDDNENMSDWVSGETFVVIGLKGRFTARMKPYDNHNGTNQNTMNEDVEDCVEVIGNIHSNPELLEGSNS